MKVRSVFVFFFLLFVHVSLVFSENDLERERLLSFADYLFKRKEYLWAANEYKRYLSYYPNDKNNIGISFKISDCFFQDGKYQETIKWNQEILRRFNSQRIRNQVRYNIGKCYFRLGHYGTALETLSLIFSKDEKLVNEVNFLQGLCLLRLEKWSLASKKFALVSKGSSLYAKASQYSKKALEGKLITLKSPFLAGILGVFPGLGYLYAGRPQTALSAFVVDVLFFYSTYSAFKKGQKSLGVIVGLFTLGWYCGSIYGGAVSAYLYNQRVKEEFFEFFED
jgi:tetratricopeptide (TPR) repeat protein